VYVLAHLAGAYLLGLLWNRAFAGRRVHLGFATAAGLLPDLIDKPISVFLPGWDHHTRGIAHSLLFLILLFALVRRDEAGRGLVLGAASHLALDTPWEYPETFLWPLLGPDFHTGGDFSLQSISQHLSRGVTIGGEFLGALVLFGAVLWEFLKARRRRMEAVREVTLE
jgi:hypothetical protein